MKSLVNVEMVVQNRVTRVTYRVTSTAPIGMILTKVSLYQWQPWACPMNSRFLSRCSML